MVLLDLRAKNTKTARRGRSGIFAKKKLRPCNFTKPELFAWGCRLTYLLMTVVPSADDVVVVVDVVVVDRLMLGKRSITV